MKDKRNFIVSIFQVVIGILAIIAFAIVGLNGENMVKWGITLFLAVAYVVLGGIGIVEYKKKK